MKLFSQALELKALRSMAVRNGLQSEDGAQANVRTDAKAMASSLLLSSLNESYFQYEPCRSAFVVLKKIAEKKSKILDYDDLLEYPTLDEEFRDILREEKRKPIKTMAQARDLIESLDKYRKSRVAYTMAKEIIEQLKESKVDPEAVLEQASKRLVEARSRESVEDKIVTMGKGGNADDLFEEVINPKKELLYTTGYTEFDERNGGFPTEGVIILAGTTSGGKSVIRMNICEHMYAVNKLDVLTVSLEMNYAKEYRRLMASRARIELKKIVHKNMSKEEKRAIKQAWRDFNKLGEENDCRYSVFCPTRGLTARDMFTLIGPYDYRVVAIDYVGLLEGVDEADQWKTLSAIVRQAKIFSAEHKCLVLVLAQLDSDSDKIRYSRGMLEHADGCWIWNYSKEEQRELHEIPVKILKGRDQELFNFALKEEFHIMRVSNLEGAPAGAGALDDDVEEVDDDAPTDKKSKKSKGKKSKKSSHSDDDDIDFDVD